MAVEVAVVLVFLVLAAHTAQQEMVDTVCHQLLQEHLQCILAAVVVVDILHFL
jgi:hypothetical protein